MSASRHKLRAETTSLAMMVVNQVLPLSGLGSSGGEGTGSLLFLLDRPSKQEDEQAFPSVLVGHSVRECSPRNQGEMAAVSLHPAKS